MPPSVAPFTARLSHLISSMLLAIVAIGGLACRPTPPLLPESATNPEGVAPTALMLELQRVEGYEQLLYQTNAPAAHGYGRGDLVGLFAEIERERTSVGYGHVTKAQGSTVAVLAVFLPDEHREGALWLAPLPDDEHLGHRIGRVVESPDTGRFHIDVGAADGVRLGDTYRVYDGVISDTNFDARTLQKRPVGLLQVVKADDGKVVSLTVLRQGKAPKGAWVELVDADVPGAGMLDDRQQITVLILNLVDERVGVREDLQRQYWEKLRNVLLDQEVATGHNRLLKLALAERKHAVVDGGAAAIMEVGLEYGADIVLWGSVRCTSSEACVRPKVTFVNQEKFGDQARQWNKRVGTKEDLLGMSDDVGGVDRSVHGLASWLAGLAYMEAQAYGDAAFHLEQVPLGSDLEREWLEAQGSLFRCYDVLGDWTKAESIARLRIDHGLATKRAWVEARGRVNLAESLYDRGLYDQTQGQAKRAIELAKVDGDTGTAASAWGRIGDILYRRGELDEALSIRKEKELPVFEKLGDVREAAMTWGKIGDILTARGELDEALRIRKEKLLPVFEKLGDVREAAVTWGKIGDILYRRGELDEALRIHKEKELPVFEKLRDVRSAAVTWGKVGDILYRKGELDEVLRIRKEKQLPVFKSLGDVRSAAVTWGQIGDILYRRGELDEALRIRKRKELPVYEKLRDARSAAVTWGKIGDILYRRGALDEALRIRKEKELPVYEKLGDVRSAAVTWGKIGDILYDRGELDEALSVHKEKELPVFEKLEDIRDTAVTWGKIGDILSARGELDEALRIRKEKELPVYEKLDDIRETAVTWGKIGDILYRRGALDEALRIRKEKELPVYEKLGDVRSAAVTWGQIGDIFAQQGHLDETIRIYETKVLPVSKALGERRGLLVGQANLALHLLARNAKGDRTRAESLLRKAMKDARTMRLPEADTIRDTLVNQGFKI